MLVSFNSILDKIQLDNPGLIAFSQPQGGGNGRPVLKTPTKKTAETCLRSLRIRSNQKEEEKKICR